MSDFQALDPKQAAEKLRSEYNCGAVFHASCEAYEAIENNDISRCLFWREVINILESDVKAHTVVGIF